MSQGGSIAWLDRVAWRRSFRPNRPLAMKPTRALAFTLLAAPLAAQVVSPSPAFGAQEGDLSLPYVWTQPSRMQQIHEDLQGTPMLIQGIAFRRDGIRNGDPHPAVAPKSITLNLAFAPAVACAAATGTFASNATGASTVVFQGMLSTPAAWQVPARTAPADFDFRIPIQPWPWSGTGAFLWDADSSATSTADRVDVDAAQPSFPLFAWCSYEMHGAGCATQNGVFEIRGSGQNLGGLGAFTVKVTGVEGPASAPAVWFVGAVPSPATLPGLCAQVWTTPVASVATATDATGHVEPFFQVPSNQAYVGLPLEMQMAAFDASQTGLPVAATNGLTYRVEPMGPAFTACCVVAPTSGASTGTLLQRAAIVRFD